MVTTRIAVGLTAGTFLIFSQSLMAEISVFNPALLEIDHQSGVDIRQFNRANLIPPGVYSVDILLTGKCLNVRMLPLFRIIPILICMPVLLPLKNTDFLWGKS